MAYLDEQDLDKWLQSQQAPTLDGPTPGAAAPAQQPGAWQRAAAMLGGQARNTAPDPAPKQSAGETWATILGMLASKDPGSVLAQDAASRRAAVDAWSKRNGPEAQLARQMAADELSVRRGNLDARNREYELQKQSLDARLGKSAPWAEAHRLVTGQAPPEPDDVRAAQAEAAQVGHFEAPPRSAALDQPSPDEVERVPDFTAPDALPKPGKASRSAGGPAAPVGGDEMTPGAARTASFDQRQLNDYRNKNAKLFDLAQAARGIDDAWARRKGKDLPGAGIIDSREWLHPFGLGQSDDDIKVRQNFASLQEYLQNKITGAAAPNEQAKRIAAIAGAQPGATEQQARVALDIVRENLRDQLRAAGTGREQAARRVLADMGGLDKWVYGDAPAAPPPATTDAPLPPAAGDTLPTTTGKVPQIPADAVGGGGGAPQNYRMRSPSGKTGSKVLTPAEVEKFKAAGWEVI